MIIHSPIVSGSLTFANGATLTPPSDSTYSGSFSGSFVGDGSNLSGVTSYTNSDTLTYINSLGVVSGSDQISLSGFNTSQLSENTNLYYTDARVKTKLNAEGVISGSAQVTSDLDTRYLNTDGDNVVSQSAQIDGINIQNNSITIAGTEVNLNNSITFAKITEGTAVVSGSSQLTSSYDTRYLNVDGDGIISESAQVDADAITNFDSNVLSYNNSIGVLSGSAQLTTEFDTRYLNTEGDSIVSQSAQIDGTSIQNNSITIAGTDVSLGDTITFSSIASGTGTISGSQQVTLNDAIKTGFDTGDVSEGTNKYYTDARVKTKLNADGVVSGSTFSSPSQGTLRATINGDNTDINLGLQAGDSPTFVGGNFTGDVQISGDLVVQGAATEIQVSELRIEDKLITVASGSANSSAANGAGLEIDRGSDSNITLKWNHSDGRLEVNDDFFSQGTISATSDIVAYVSSDERLKTEIKPIENPIEKINSISGNSFVWDEEKQNIYKGKDYGVIAQEIEKVLPELVNTREDGYKAVKYDRIVSLLIEGIKELSDEVNQLKEKINKE